MLNLLSLFSILGTGSCSAQSGDGIQHGNFTIQKSIETEKGSGSVLGRKYDTRSYLIKYGILYKGKKIKFPTPLQKGSGYNYPWRVYIVDGAPVPTLIAGSQNVFLITEKNDKLNIVLLNHIDSDFASIQWLDNKNAQPGDEIQIHDPQGDHLLDSPIVLSGGKHLLINRFTVLDVSSLVSYPFNKRHIHEYEGWRIALDRATGYEIAVGFSKEFKQVVFRALKLDEKVEGKYYSALVSFGYANDSIHVVPFSRTTFRLKSIDEIHSAWVTNFFHWNDEGKLDLRPDAVSPAWQGKINFENEKFINYELYPVKASMVAVFQDFLKGKFGSANEFSIIDETNNQSTQLTFKININNKIFQLAYDKTNLQLTFNVHFSESHTEDHRNIIVSAGRDFNEELRQYRHDKHFEKYNE